jgi:hypothetical protein
MRGGLKLPTGASDFNAYDMSEVANPYFQLGTGSLDVPLNLVYTLKKNEFGINLNLLYQLNFGNSDAN